MVWATEFRIAFMLDGSLPGKVVEAEVIVTDQEQRDRPHPALALALGTNGVIVLGCHAGVSPGPEDALAVTVGAGEASLFLPGEGDFLPAQGSTPVAVAVQFHYIPHGDAGQIGVGLEIILAPVEDFLQQLMPGCLGSDGLREPHRADVARTESLHVDFDFHGEYPSREKRKRAPEERKRAFSSRVGYYAAG
jgi:hypothetical protein